jgi:uncharacterized protein YbaR (Trm112 family)
MVSQDLLEILRCPVCVHNEPEGGDLEKHGNWLICQDCGRNYPIRDDIPVMLIEEGDRFRDIPADELPEIPPPEEPQPMPAPPVAGGVSTDELLPYVLLGAAGLLVGLFVFWLLRQRCCSGEE